MALGRTLRAGALVLVAAVCATSGCGLPDATPDIDPPELEDSDDAFKLFRFKVPRSIDAPFLGVEVYYRFADRDSDSSPERGLELLQNLTPAGFRRVARSDDVAPSPNLPLIDRPNADVTVTLDFSGVAVGNDPVATYVHQDGSQRQVSLRREVLSGTSTYKRFACGEFTATDEDIHPVRDQLADTETCASVQLQLYALSYGGTDRFTVYSDAVDLGTINLTFGRR